MPSVDELAWAHALDLIDPPDFIGDPALWARERLGEHLWSKQREICASVAANRYTAVKSCHASGKSFTAARIAAWWIDSHPPGEAFVVSTAPTNAQVRAILWREINRAHAKGKLRGRVNQATWYLTEGDHEELVAIGRKPSDTDDDAFQGIHARYILVIIDEACGVPKQIFDAVDTLATNTSARVLAIGNPDDPQAHFATICAPGSGWNVLSISAFDTPNFTDEEVPDSLREQLVSAVWVAERAKRWGVRNPLYVSKVTGRFPEISDDTLIPPGWVARAQQAELGRDLHDAAFGVDVARFGSDSTIIVLREGNRARVVHAVQGNDTMVTAGNVRRLVRAHPTHPVANVDDVGVGGGVVDALSADGVDVAGINGGRAPVDKQTFGNLRAEMFWALRDRFEEGSIDIDPDDEDLAAQLCGLKYRIQPRTGLIYMESKEELRKRGLSSPDRADALALAFHLATGAWNADPDPAPSITGEVLTQEW